MKFVSGAIVDKVAHSALLSHKSSPKVLFGAGIVGMVGSTVLACRATLKMDTVMEETKAKLDLAKTLKHDDYSDKDRSRDISLIYFQTGVKVVKLYGPAIIVGGASIACLTSSHAILTKRNAGLVAAYSALETGFRQYRARVVEKYGEDVDRDFRYGTRREKIVDPNTNKEKTVTRVSLDDPSIYARFFDNGSPSWSKEPEYNLFFLQSQQNYANDLLRSRGHVFLNEAYDMLGIPRSEAGAVVGWLLSPNGDTDNHVSFGVFEGKTEKQRDFVNGLEGAILLDFNVDGVIFDKIGSVPKEALSWQRDR
jgi:Family of unknown function (DUF6353)